MRKTLYRVSDDAWEVFGSAPEDIGTSFVLKFGEDRATFQIGPMEKEQLSTHFGSDEVKRKLPETSLFVDFDLYRSEPNWPAKEYPKKVREYLKDGGQRIQEMSISFVQKLGEFK
jgi:hypothetical protein